MSTELMTIEQAAVHLGVSVRTVRQYIANGYFSTQRQAGSRRKWLLPLEVESFRQDRTDFQTGSRLTRAEFVKLRARVRSLEGKMDVALRMLDAKSDPLQMDAAYARDLHAACTGQLSRANWDQGEISGWAQIFLRISEEDFKSLKDATDDPKPWVPYLRLCNAMAAHLVNHERYEVSLELQGLHRELAEGRRRLRVSAMCFEDMYSYTLPALQKLAGLDASVSDTLTHVLRRKGR